MRNKRLGKGLSSLIRELDETNESAAGQTGLKEKYSSVSTSTTLNIRDLEVKKIKPGKWQPRQNFKDEEISQLAASIEENGFLQPIVVCETGGENFDIIAGERRWRAAVRLKKSHIPCVVKTVSDKEGHKIALIENLQRENLTSIEEAEAYDKLVHDQNMTHDEIATSIGKSRSHITNTMRLLSLPSSIRAIVNNGEISAGHGRCLIGIEEKEALVLVDEIIQKKLNVRQLERILKQRKAESSEAENAEETERESEYQSFEDQSMVNDLSAIAKHLSLRLNAAIVIKANKNGGEVRIKCNSPETLDNVLTLLH